MVLLGMPMSRMLPSVRIAEPRSAATAASTFEVLRFG
jgi:hypothetical protein